MYERNAEQDEVEQDPAANSNTASGPGGPIKSFLAENRAVVEEYADGDCSTAWLNEALLSWTGCDGQTNRVTEQ